MFYVKYSTSCLIISVILDTLAASKLDNIFELKQIDMSQSKLDKIDLKILKILQANSKITNLDLSKKIGLSPAPTLERVKKLENGGVIQSYHAQVDPQAIGLSVKTFVFGFLGLAERKCLESLPRKDESYQGNCGMLHHHWGS